LFFFIAEGLTYLCALFPAVIAKPVLHVRHCEGRSFPFVIARGVFTPKQSSLFVQCKASLDCFVTPIAIGAPRNDVLPGIASYGLLRRCSPRNDMFPAVIAKPVLKAEAI
jgi:hypothetical protein